MKKTDIKVFEYELPIEIDSETGGFVAKCSVWKDCYAQGTTIDEAVSEITAVAAALIEVYKEENKKIPLKFSTIKKTHFTIPVITSHEASQISRNN